MTQERSHLQEQHIDRNDRTHVILPLCGRFALVNMKRGIDSDRRLEEHECHKTIVRAVVICPVPGAEGIDWKRTVSLSHGCNLTLGFCLLSAVTC